MIAPRTLEDLQDFAAARIAGDDFLGEITVITERYSSTTDAEGNVQVEEDIETRVLMALQALNEKAGKNGAVIVVRMPTLEKANPNVSGLSAELVLRVRYIVAPLFSNGTQGYKKSEGQLALRGAVLFQMWSFLGGQNPFTMAANPLEDINGELPPGNNGYEVEHRMRWGVSSGNKVSLPAVAIANGLMTLTCATAGAQIRYTLTASGAQDAGSPSKGNAASVAYTEPFAVAVGDVVRACANKADFFESDTTEVTVT